MEWIILSILIITVGVAGIADRYFEYKEKTMNEIHKKEEEENVK